MSSFSAKFQQVSRRVPKSRKLLSSQHAGPGQLQESSRKFMRSEKSYRTRFTSRKTRCGSFCGPSFFVVCIVVLLPSFASFAVGAAHTGVTLFCLVRHMSPAGRAYRPITDNSLHRCWSVRDWLVISLLTSAPLTRLLGLSFYILGRGCLESRSVSPQSAKLGCQSLRACSQPPPVMRF